MGTVFTGATMSIDGYISGPEESGFDQIEAAVAAAQEIAGDKGVGVNGGEMARQALEAGLLDEVWVDLAPVLLGGGRPFFDAVAGGPHALDGPVSVVQGERVTHLRYRVRK